MELTRGGKKHVNLQQKYAAAVIYRLWHRPKHKMKQRTHVPRPEGAHF